MSGPQSGGGSSPTSTTTSGLPEWALPYAQDTLAKQSALSDVAYQPYGGNRIQGFTPMQETARQNAAGMGTSALTGQAAGIVGGIAGQAAGTTYNPSQFDTRSFTGQGTADQYMNPYMQNVVDIQKREAQRQSGMQGVQQAGQATSAGALGGSRDAIMRAERERNLGQQMGDIQAVGSNAAYTNAQNQFNAEQNRGLTAQQSAEQSRQYGAGLGMQGLQAGLQAAGQLGNLGQQQFQQGMDVNKLQAAYGAQQQGMGQRGLDMAYQDFLNQKAYPQTQLSNMASMMRGLPINTSTTTGTPGSPSNLQTLGGLAQIGYGLSGFFADGGEVSSYADGGSVDSEQNIESIVRRLSDQQLAQAEQAAKARGDIVQMQVINMEKAARASMKRGIAAAPVDMDQMLPTEESMARGGIVAFYNGGSAYSDGNEGEDEAQNYMQTAAEEGMDGGGDEDENTLAGSIRALQKYKPRVPKTAAESDAEFEANKARVMKGVDTTDRDATRADIKRMQDESDADLKRGRGLAFIQSGAAMFEGNDFGRSLGKSASAFSQAYGDAIKANQAKKSALANMKLNLAEAQRKEQMGANREAIALTSQARRDEVAADNAENNRRRSLGILYGLEERAKKAAVVKPPAVMRAPEQLAAAELALEADPTNKKLQGDVRALRRTVAATKSSFSINDIGSVREELERDKAAREREAAAAAAGVAESKTNAGITAEVEKRALLDPEYQQALSKGDTGGMKVAKDRMYTEIQNRQKPAAKTPAAKPAATPATSEQADFDAKWAKLPSGQSLVGPDGKTYTKK